MLRTFSIFEIVFWEGFKILFSETAKFKVNVF